MKIIVSGGFDPIHEGHIKLFENASQLGEVICLLNTDNWLMRKKGKIFLPFEKRKYILESCKYISEVREAKDKDDTVVESLMDLIKEFDTTNLIFANGGDRNALTTPEASFCKANKIELKYNMSHPFRNSSSQLLDTYNTKLVNRSWGYWQILRDFKPIKVKELFVKPGQCLSYQKHKYRSELWFVVYGDATVIMNNKVYHYLPGNTLDILPDTWHQLCNLTTKDLVIIEIQYGPVCQEEDIERIK